METNSNLIEGDLEFSSFMEDMPKTRSRSLSLKRQGKNTTPKEPNKGLNKDRAKNLETTKNNTTNKNQEINKEDNKSSDEKTETATQERESTFKKYIDNKPNSRSSSQINKNKNKNQKKYTNSKKNEEEKGKDKGNNQKGKQKEGAEENLIKGEEPKTDPNKGKQMIEDLKQLVNKSTEKYHKLHEDYVEKMKEIMKSELEELITEFVSETLESKTVQKLKEENKNLKKENQELREKVKLLEKKTPENKKIEKIEDKVSKMYEASKETNPNLKALDAPWSEVLGRKARLAKQKQDPNLIKIQIKGDGMNRSTLGKTFKGENLDLKAEKCISGKDMVTIITKDPKVAEKLEEICKKEKDYEYRELKPYKVCTYKVTNVDDYISKEDFKSEIFKKNFQHLKWSPEKIEESIKIVATFNTVGRFSRDKLQNIFFNASEELSEILQNVKSVYLGTMRCKIHQTILILPCAKCASLYHATKYCDIKEDKRYCFRCGDTSHKIAECKNKTCCVNCKKAKKSDTEHRTGSQACPLLQAEAIKRANRFGFGNFEQENIIGGFEDLNGETSA
ncbi:unnamed protein product [Bemisia tabaci]|uniref:CCHC-type domain-containing protein n=1 Tax=Bemisia tabaci TaxID=7038 RepID=A0A9P0A012_BEMTA|nr:unnamed protein product [Bemisia tabaci]